MNLIKRCIELLPNSSKKKINIILVIQFFKFLLEMIGIGIIIPVIYLLAKGNEEVEKIISNYQFFSFFPQEFLRPENIIIFILASIIFIFLIKFLFTIFSNLYEQKWAETANVKTTCELFGFYTSDITDLAARENYNLIRNLTTEINNFYKFFVRGIIQVFGETIKLIGILVFLFFINPKIFITGLLIALIMALIFSKFFRKKIESYGAIKTRNSGLLIKHITEGLNSVKEIKLSENPKYFFNLLKRYAKENADIQVKFSMLAIYPRQILEILSILIICGLVYYLSIIFPNQNSSSLFFLGVYITALIRIIPIVNMLYVSFQQISYARTSFEVVEKELNKNISKNNFFERENSNNNFKTKIESVEVKDLSFSYDKSIENLIENVNFKFEKGKIYCLTGSSGAGKSTFINLLMGFIKPGTGSISFNDNQNINDHLAEWQNNIDYLSQKVFLLNESIKNNIAFSQDSKKINENEIVNSLKKANLYEHVKKLEHGMDTLIGDDGIKLSGGQKQRIGIARIFYFDKTVTILDEFTSSLDFENEKNIFKQLSSVKKDKIIIIISHSKNIIESSDVVLNFDNTRSKTNKID